MLALLSLTVCLTTPFSEYTWLLPVILYLPDACSASWETIVPKPSAWLYFVDAILSTPSAWE